MKQEEYILEENSTYSHVLKNIFMFFCLNTVLMIIYLGPSFYLSNLGFHYFTFNDYLWYYQPFAVSLIKSNYCQNLTITALWWFYCSYYCSSHAMKKYTRALLSTGMTAHFLFMAIQYISYYYGGSFLTTVYLDNMEYIVLFWKMVIIFLFLGGVVWFLCYKILSLPTAVQTKKMLFLYIAIIGIVVFGNTTKLRNSYSAYFPVTDGSPYKSFYKDIIRHAKTGKEELEAVPEKINAPEKLELQKYGIYLGGKHPNSLVNKDKYKNIIILFVESLSLDLAGQEFNHRKITPNIDSFMAKSITHSSYYNHTSPTAAGIRGQLYSEYVYTAVTDWYQHYTKDLFNYPAKSLVNVLNDNGYETTYVNYGLPEQSYNNILFKKFGFQKQYYVDDILTGTSLRGPRGTDDETVLNFVAKLVTGHTENRKFIAVSTIGTHSPYTIYKRKLDDNAPDSVNALYSLDYAFGTFLKQIEAEMDNTLLVLTADHAMGAGPGNADIYHKEPGSSFEKIMLAIWSPKNKNAVVRAGVASSLSLAPTVLDLNGLDIPDSFTGKSLFDKATAQQKMALGIGNNYYFIVRDGKTEQYKTDKLSKVPSKIPDKELIEIFVNNDRYHKWPQEFKKSAE